jgi:ATP synthase assembly factor FMC1, mitochondrial
MSTHSTQARSLYRRLLRELPSRSPSILANPSPIQRHIRDDLSLTSSSGAPSPSLAHQAQKPTERRLQEAEQYLHYLKAQRGYITLLERYNPGMNMNEEERVRLTARRVGMDLPPEMQAGDERKGEDDEHEDVETKAGSRRGGR